MKNKDLAVVCCYFNPFKYKKKYLNFIEFHSNLQTQGVDIQVVELAYGEDLSSLPPNINAITLNSDQILWHKENLLNIGIKKLISEGYENIAWLDSDVIFKDSHWVEDTIHCLQIYNLCQLFSTAESQLPDGKSTFRPGCVKEWSSTGSIMPTSRAYHTGYAWASRSDILSKCLLYDKAIIGGGDSLIWFASFSNTFNLSEIIKNHPISHLGLSNYVLDYLNWGKIWGELINSKVSYISCGLTSLSHGYKKDRAYKSRYSSLSEYNYDPNQDLHYQNDLLQSSNSPLNKKIVDYFKNRNEDELLFLSKFLNKASQWQKLRRYLRDC